MSTRGAHSWVVSAPTGLPDWTSSVSSSPRAWSALRGGVVRAQGALPCRCRRRRRGRRGARRLGVEVVHEHPQRGLGLPECGGEVGSAGGVEGGGAWCGRACEVSIKETAASTTARTDVAAGGLEVGGEVACRARGRGCRARAAGREDRPRDRGRPAAGRAGPSRGRRSGSRCRASASGRRRRDGSLRAACQPIDTWSSCMADDGMESTLAGTARRLSSETRAAACTGRSCCRSPRRGRGRGTRAGRCCARRRGSGRCGARSWWRCRRRRSPGSRGRSPRVRRGSCRSSPRGRRR